MPAPAERGEHVGVQRRGQLDLLRERSCSIAWRTSRSSSRPRSSSSSQGSMSRTMATHPILRAADVLPIGKNPHPPKEHPLDRSQAHPGGLGRHTRPRLRCPPPRPRPTSATRPRTPTRAATPSTAARSTRTRPPSCAARRCASATARARASRTRPYHSPALRTCGPTDPGRRRRRSSAPVDVYEAPRAGLIPPDALVAALRLL